MLYGGINLILARRRNNTTINTLSNWETGRSRLDINLIPSVCGALQVSLSELFGIENPEEVKTGLAPREQGLLNRYNRLRPGKKAVVDSMIDTMPGVQEAEDRPEIGAFIMGNETYIKEYSEKGLVSINSRYPMMRFEDEADVYLIGRVLGKPDPECIAAAKDVDMYRMVHEPDPSLQTGGRDDGEVVCREFIDRYLW